MNFGLKAYHKQIDTHSEYEISVGGRSFIADSSTGPINFLDNTLTFIDTWFKTFYWATSIYCIPYQDILKEIFKNIPPTNPVTKIDDFNKMRLFLTDADRPWFLKAKIIHPFQL